MYKLLLISKYLRKRRIAWVSLIAVMLCTAMVLVVISVMGGWLRMFRETNHSLIGDIIVDRISRDGFAHYDEMIDAIKKIPEVKAVSPQVHGFGLANFKDLFNEGVMVVGVDLSSIGEVNGFVRSLHLQPDLLLKQAEADENESARLRQAAATRASEADKTNDDLSRFDASEMKAEADDLAAQAPLLRARAAAFPSWDKVLPPDEYRGEMPKSKTDVSKLYGMIVGDGVIGLGKDDSRDPYIYRAWVQLTVLNLATDVQNLQDSTTPRRYWIVDDSRTGVFQVDQSTVYVPFDVLQKDLQMDAYDTIDSVTGEKRTTPARCNQILISLKDGFDPHEFKEKIADCVNEIAGKYGMIYPHDPIMTQTWDEKQADFLSAVEHEKVLLVILFAIISVVAVFLIFCIFFMIVVEKTRDIGIIKSVGATGSGIAAIFLGYGLVIGIIGGGMGLLLGYLIIHNINGLHAWLGVHMGIKIWDAKTYSFDSIPDKLDPHDVFVIVSVAVLSSVLGAVVPAIRAARMNPVDALRWE